MFRNWIACVVACLLTTAAYADQVNVLNASFENPTQDPGGWTNVLPDWAGPTNAGDSFIEYIAGFNSAGNNHLGMVAGAEVSQDLGIPAAPNTTYQLTVGVGNRNTSFTVPGNESRFGLYIGGDAAAGGTLLADSVFDASTIPASSFADQTLSITTGASVPAGNLFLSLRSTGQNRSHFDNVRLVSVPEPTALGLSVCGLLGLALRRRVR